MVATTPILDGNVWRAGAALWGVLWLTGLSLLFLVAGRRAWRLRPADALALAAAVGLPSTAALVLGVGQWPLGLQRFPWDWMGALGWLAVGVWFWIPRRLERVRPVMPPEATELSPAVRPAAQRLLGGAATALLVGWLAFLLGPAFCPPISYDVLEYHLGFVPHVFETGRVQPIPHVFYTAQPLATEMLYLLAATLEGAARGWAPGLTQWLLIALGVLLTMRAAGRLGIDRALRPWLALLLITHPVVLPAMLDRMTDWTGVVMLAAGLLAWGLARGGGGESGRALLTPAQAAALMGWCAGGAVAAKWTHAGTVALPLVVCLVELLRGGHTPAAEGRARAAIAASLFALAALAPLAPWMLWLLDAAGNPFAPFGAGLFPTDAWPPERLRWLLDAHGPLRPWQGTYWANLAVRTAWGLGGLPLIAWALVGALFLWALPRLFVTSPSLDAAAQPARRALRTLVVGMAAALLLWGQLRHGAARFLAPTTLAAALAIGLELERIAAWRPGGRPWGRWIGCWVPAAAGGIALLVAAGVVDANGLGLGAWRFAWRGGSLIDYWRAPDKLGLTAELYDAVDRLPEDARLMAIHEARRYLIPRPVTLASVFDRHPLRDVVAGAAIGDEIRRRLIAAGYTHLLVNEFERVRILTMHPPPNLAGDERLRSLIDAGERAAIAERYVGDSEFALEPLSAAERRAYGEFLSRMRRRAIWVAPNHPGATPAMWIAPLE